MVDRHYGTVSTEHAALILKNRDTVLTGGLRCVECGARVDGERDVNGMPRAALHTVKKVKSTRVLPA